MWNGNKMYFYFGNSNLSQPLSNTQGPKAARLVIYNLTQLPLKVVSNLITCTTIEIETNRLENWPWYAPVANLIKHFAIVNYNSRVVIWANL